MKNITLTPGKIYLIQPENEYAFDKRYYDSLVPLVHSQITNRMDEGIVYYFEDPITYETERVDEFGVQESVFETETEFLKYIVYKSDIMKIEIDDFVQEKINNSQHKEPDKWI